MKHKSIELKMVWKSIILTFCLIKSSSHDQSEYTNIFHSYLKKVLDQSEAFNLHVVLRYKNYIVRTTQE